VLQSLHGHPQWLLDVLGEVWGDTADPLPGRQSLPKVEFQSLEGQIQGALPVGPPHQRSRRGSPPPAIFEAAAIHRGEDANQTDLGEKTRSDLVLPFARDTDAKFSREI
jgi:hypothetical protein